MFGEFFTLFFELFCDIFEVMVVGIAIATAIFHKSMVKFVSKTIALCW